MATMKLMTKQIEKALENYPLRSQDGKDVKVGICKFFNPYGRGTWIVLEGEKQPDGDWLFFGLVNIFETEYGYFRLSELEKVKVNVFGCPFPLERDKGFFKEKFTRYEDGDGYLKVV